MNPTPPPSSEATAALGAAEETEAEILHELARAEYSTQRYLTALRKALTEREQLKAQNAELRQLLQDERDIRWRARNQSW